MRGPRSSSSSNGTPGIVRCPSANAWSGISIHSVSRARSARRRRLCGGRVARPRPGNVVTLRTAGSPQVTPRWCRAAPAVNAGRRAAQPQTASPTRRPPGYRGAYPIGARRVIAGIAALCVHGRGPAIAAPSTRPSTPPTAGRGARTTREAARRDRIGPADHGRAGGVRRSSAAAPAGTSGRCAHPPPRHGRRAAPARPCAGARGPRRGSARAPACSRCRPAAARRSPSPRPRASPPPAAPRLWDRG